MAQKKIAILGGGMSGLSAAYQLSRTAALRSQYDITVYQMGWRLGGKAASGRDKYGRNLEHGLHVWFGCYYNVFEMTRELYGAWVKPAGCPLQSVNDVAKPQAFTPIGVQRADGTWTYYPLTWPLNTDVPGVGGLNQSPSAAWATMVGLFWGVIQGLAADLNIPVGAFPWLSQVQTAAIWVNNFPSNPVDTDAEADALIGLFENAKNSFNVFALATEAWVTNNPSFTLKVRIVRELFEIFVAVVRGYYKDLALPHKSYDAIDHLDFRQWLKMRGANAAIVDSSSVVRILYDTMFQYVDGDAAKPSYAAGTALGVIARLVSTYKGSMMWNIQAGMGEAVITPLYEVLKARGVKFEFFHKVKKLGLATNQRSIATITFDVQAKVKAGNPPYDPTFLDPANLRCWPSEPDWNQLQNGAALQAQGVDFESHWVQAPPAAQRTLTVGSGFDKVVLAIAMGAYKPLNPQAGMCDELISADARFSNYVKGQGLVPSQGVQLWSDRTTAQLGWTHQKAALVSGPQYLNIWDDMTQVLAFESHTVPAQPKSLHYLTGTLKTTLYKKPSTAAAVPQNARNQVRNEAVAWLNASSPLIFPLARTGGNFDWNALKSFTGTVGIGRLNDQWLRANVNPTECCVGTIKNTTKYRLYPDQHQFANLFLAGEATRHGFNTTTIEGAVMSGMAAARAISGSPAQIVGYDFLTTPLS